MSVIAAPRIVGPLRAFLAAAKTVLRSAVTEQRHVDFVVGNESADLDSITSALLYAYLRSATSHPPKIYVPLLNIPTRDIAIRPELLWLLPRAGLTPSHLLTLSDVPGLLPSSSSSSSSSPSSSSPSSSSPTPSPQTSTPALPSHLTSFTLVDHNALTGVLASHYAHKQPSVAAHIAGCIDHHADERFVPSSASPRIIERAGSCTSLVLHTCRAAWDELSSDATSTSVPAHAQGDAAAGLDDAGARRGWDAQIARLAIASVLVDTQCLRDENKTTDADVDAVEYLEARIVLGLKGRETWDREEFFRGLTAAKGNLEKLSVGDVLRKDYKEWVEESGDVKTDGEGDGEGKKLRLGFSASVKPISWLASKAARERSDSATDTALSSALRDFARERSLDVFALGTAFADEGGAFRRELLVWMLDGGEGGGEEGGGGNIMDRFIEGAQDELQLREWRGDGLSVSQVVERVLRVWWVGDLGKSRKQIGPALRRVLFPA